MWLMLQQAEPEDFVIATGEQRSVREFVTCAASELNIAIEWHGNGVAETGVDKASRQVIVRVDTDYFRPTEVDALLGDASRARDKLKWWPRISFDELVREMAHADLRNAERDALVAQQHSSYHG